MTTKAFQIVRSIALAALVAACAPSSTAPGGGDDTGLPPPTTAPAATSGNTSTTFDHDNEQDVDPFELLQRMQLEGPPDFQARVHSCPKMKYATIGRVLASRGVNLGNGDPASAGNLWANADQALGVANYGARIPESVELTTASAAKLFDIFTAAAPEIIASMPSRAECTVGGVAARMFNDSGQCTIDGITCLIGVPATTAHLDLCNSILTKASTPLLGQTIAVATLAAAAHTCE